MIDISDNVITRMKKRCEDSGRSMIYEVGDVTNMNYSDEKFDTVIGRFDLSLESSRSSSVEIDTASLSFKEK